MTLNPFGELEDLEVTSTTLYPWQEGQDGGTHEDTPNLPPRLPSSRDRDLSVYTYLPSLSGTHSQNALVGHTPRTHSHSTHTPPTSCRPSVPWTIRTQETWGRPVGPGGSSRALPGRKVDRGSDSKGVWGGTSRVSTVEAPVPPPSPRGVRDKRLDPLENHPRTPFVGR